MKRVSLDDISDRRLFTEPGVDVDDGVRLQVDRGDRGDIQRNGAVQHGMGGTLRCHAALPLEVLVHKHIQLVQVGGPHLMHGQEEAHTG